MDLTSVEITSERLRLVPISEKFIEQIFQEFTPEVTNYMYPKSPEKIEETEKFVKESIGKLRSGRTLQTVVINKLTEEFLGCAGLHSVDTPTPEFGIWIKSSAWGKGLGREAIAALKEWADKNITYKYIKYPVDKRNIPSRKIPESLGGVEEKEETMVSESGKKLDITEYRIYPTTTPKPLRI